MKLSRAAAGVSFLGALVIGMAASGFFVTGVEAEPPAVTVTYKLTPMPARPAYVEEVPVYTEDLVGVWRGTWDHTQVPCTLEISRIDGNRFHGILKQGDAVIAFAGTLDVADRRVFFRETEVIGLGAYSEWSLGTNSGAFSPDGNSLTGTGIDKWGTYSWNLTKE